MDVRSNLAAVGEDQDRIDELEAAAVVNHGRIDALEAAAVDAEAAALVDHGQIDKLSADGRVSDARIAELVAEVDSLLAAREHAGVIEQAKGVIMSTTHCSPDAAFAVLVAASQRENVKLFTIAARIAAAQDEQI